MPGPVSIVFRRFAGADHIAQSFMGLVRNPGGRHISRHIPARQFLGVGRTRPDPVPAFTRTRGDATGIHTEVCALPVAHVPGRTGFVAGPKPLRRTQLACHFANRFESIRIIPTDRTSPPVQLRQSSQQGHRVPQTVVWSLRPIPVVRALRRTSQSQRNLRTATQLVGRCLIFAYWCTTVSQVEPCVLCYPLDSITSRGFQKE